MRRKIGTTKRRTAKRRPTTHRRRRRISGIGKIDAGGILMKAAALGAGAIAGRELDLLVKKMGITISPTVYNLIMIGVGAFLPKVVKNNKFVADMADGVMANAVMMSMVGLGVINGMGNPSMVSYRINGGGRLRTIAGGGNLSAIAGGGNLSAIAGNAIPMSSRVRNSANATQRRPGENMY